MTHDEREREVQERTSALMDAGMSLWEAIRAAWRSLQPIPRPPAPQPPDEEDRHA